MKPYQDKNNPGNGPEYHTGKPCIEEDCENPAGTWWSPLWCFECNVKRFDRLTVQLQQVETEVFQKRGKYMSQGATTIAAAEDEMLSRAISVIGDRVNNLLLDAEDDIRGALSGEDRKLKVSVSIALEQTPGMCAYSVLLQFPTGKYKASDEGGVSSQGELFVKGAEV